MVWPQDIPESDIMTWFAKIDGDCDGFVEWDECFNFLIAKVWAAAQGPPVTAHTPRMKHT